MYNSASLVAPSPLRGGGGGRGACKHIRRLNIGPPPLRRLRRHLPRKGGRIASAPRPVAQHPRREPPCARFDLRRRIPTASTPWMAAAEPCACHPGSCPRAMRANAIGGVGRAGRQIAAPAPNQGRERPFVELDEGQQAPRWNARQHAEDGSRLWIKDRAKRSRCGAPDLAPPALAGSGHQPKHHGEPLSRLRRAAPTDVSSQPQTLTLPENMNSVIPGLRSNIWNPGANAKLNDPLGSGSRCTRPE